MATLDGKNRNPRIAEKGGATKWKEFEYSRR